MQTLSQQLQTEIAQVQSQQQLIQASNDRQYQYLSYLSLVAGGSLLLGLINVFLMVYRFRRHTENQMLTSHRQETETQMTPVNVAAKTTEITYEDEALQLYTDTKTMNQREEPVLDLNAAFPEPLDMGPGFTDATTDQPEPTMSTAVPESNRVQDDVTTIEEQEFNFDFGQEDQTKDFPTAMRSAREKQPGNRKRQRRNGDS